MRSTWLELLRRLALNDENTLARVMGGQPIEPVPLDPKTTALVRVAALVAVDASEASYQWAVDVAHAAGAEDAEIVDILFALAPVVGEARVNAAATTLASALGYELDGR